MNKIITISLMLISSSIFAAEWTTYREAALAECNQNNNDLPVLYADRAQVNFLTGNYEEALSDINKALNSELLTGREQAMAISLRVAARANLGIAGGYEEDLEFLAKNIESNIEVTEDHYIIRDVPKCKAFLEPMAAMFVQAGICDSLDDVQMVSFDTCLIKKSISKRYTQEVSGMPCQCCSMDTSKQARLDLLSMQACRDWCDANAVQAINWCSFYPTLCLINACNRAVSVINNDCHTCCNTGLSQDFCAAPFGNIVAVMQQFLPPCGCN